MQRWWVCSSPRFSLGCGSPPYTAPPISQSRLPASCFWSPGRPSQFSSWRCAHLVGWDWLRLADPPTLARNEPTTWVLIAAVKRLVSSSHVKWPVVARTAYSVVGHHADSRFRQPSFWFYAITLTS